MSEEKQPQHGRREYDRSTWTDGVHGKLEMLRVVLEENTKAILAMTARLNLVFLVPLAIAAMGVSTWALFQGKISEHSWLGVMLGCLAQFFGEGVKKIIEGIFPWGKKPVVGKTPALLGLLFAGAAFLTGWLF